MSDKLLTPTEKSLLLAVPELAHLEGLCSILNDPAVANALGGPRSRDDVAKSIHNERRHWQEQGFGPWVVIDRTSGSVLGRGGIRRARVRDADEVELFYAVSSSLWGRGIATSLARSAVALGLRMKLPSIVTFMLEGNGGSKRVAEKLGFAREGEFLHAGMPHVLYRRNLG